MQLKSSQQKPWLLNAVRKIRHKKAYLIFSALLYTLLIFVFGAYVHRRMFFGRTLKPLIKQNISLVPKVIAGLLSKPEHITIDIKHKNFQKLAYKRQTALATGVLISSSDDYVPATIRHNDNIIQVKIRLKGDWTDHLNDDKWSFRIKVKGNETLFGMKRFSIQHPKTRNYIYEWIYHQALKREGVLSLRYDFIDVTLNGKDLGVYAIEEHFEKHLIESNRHREGPILKFNEDIVWREVSNTEFYRENHTGLQSMYSSDISAFKLNRIFEDSSLYKQFLIGKNLLEAFRSKHLTTHKVFDLEKMARYFAISDLLGAHHGTKNWVNLRLYYNPVTSLLEPIGFDGDAGERITYILGNQENKMGQSPYTELIPIFFSDYMFFRKYVKTLERISQTSYLDSLLVDLKDELEKNLAILNKEFTISFSFSENVLYENQQYIREVLNPVKGMQAYFCESSHNSITLGLVNIQFMPIEVLNVSYSDSILLTTTENVILPGRKLFEPVAYKKVSFKFPEGFIWADTMVTGIRVNYRLLGTSNQRSEQVFSWNRLDDNFIEQDFIRQNPNVRKFEFLVTDELNKRIYIKTGTWNLCQNLIIPEGYRVICREGTQLNLTNFAKILSYSPLEFVGSEEYPIVIQSTDSTGQGIVVMNASETSILKYVTFNNLSNPSQGGWVLTGAVTFYESPVKISNSQFLGNRSEDALNIIRSEFTIDKTLFNNTLSDAFDADFTKGKITNSSFIFCGNDAVDVSGSVIGVQDVFIKSIGDKGLSAGENSQMTAKQVSIRDAEIAIASKDMSEISIADIRIAESKIGFTVFQKKSEFGPGKITANMVSIEKTTIPYLVEEGSILLVDGGKIEANRKNLKEILYGVEDGKSSK